MLNRAPIRAICDVASAEQLARISLFHRPPARIVVAVRNIPEAEQREIEKRLNILYAACGCIEGTWALGFAIAAWAAGWAWAGAFPRHALTMIPVGIAIAIAGAAAGKIFGLFLARHSLRIELFRLAARSPSRRFAFKEWPARLGWVASSSNKRGLTNRPT